MIPGAPQIQSTRLVGGNWYGSRTLVTTIPGSLKPDSGDPETETGNLETEKRVHRIHGTLETGLHEDPPQPGGPLKGGPADYFVNLRLPNLESFGTCVYLFFAKLDFSEFRFFEN